MKEVKEKLKKWLDITATLGIVGIFVIFIFWLGAEETLAVNTQITFQGKLTNASGNVVSDGTYYLKFTIYDTATGGTCQYTATSSCASVTSTAVTVTSGLFSINLGDTSASLAALPATLFNNSALYLGIMVCSGPSTGCDSEMTPRKRLTASPYAFNADYLGGVTTSTAGGDSSYIPATDSSGNLRISHSFFAATSTSGQIGFGTSTVPAGAKVFIDSTTASDKLLVVRANASQTGNLQEWQNNAGKALAYLDSSGYLYIGDGSTSSTLQKNLLKIAYSSTDNAGKFYVDSSGNVSASGSVYAFGNVTSTGIIYANAGLISSASSTFTSNLNITGNLRASSTLLVGTVAGTNNFYVNGATTQIGSTSASGTLQAYGNAQFTGNLTPEHHNLYDIGSYTASWNDVFASGTIYGTLSGVLTSAGHLLPSVDNLYDIGTSSTQWRYGNFQGGLLVADGTNTSTLANASLIIGQGVTDNLGKFYIDSSGNVSASGTLAAFGNTTLGNSDAAGGNTTRVYGALAMGAAPTGNAQLYIKASSTAAIPLSIFDVNSLHYFSVASSTYYGLGGNGSDSLIYNSAVLTVGDANNGIGSAIVLRDGELVILNDNRKIGVDLFSPTAGQLYSGLVMGDGSNTSTLSHTQFALGIGSGSNLGKFYIDSSGNVSASGTLTVFGAANLANVIPISNDNYDIGSFGWAWQDIIASGTVRIAGSSKSYLEIGGYGGGLGQLYIKASSTIAKPLIIRADANQAGTAYLTEWQDASGNAIMSFASSTDSIQTALLHLGSVSHYGIFNVGSSSGSSTLTSDYLKLNILGGFNVGKFYVDSSGNVSASGTLTIFGGNTDDPSNRFVIDPSTGDAGSSSTLTSYVYDEPGGTGFVFNTVASGGAMTSGTDRMLAVFQNNGINKVLISAGGNVYATSSFIANSAVYGIGDVAEYVNLVPGETVETGEVVVVDKAGFNQYKKSSSAYTKEVAGVISDSGAFIIGAVGDNRAPLALTGLVKVKVTDENGSIGVGDYLVTASQAGYAMKYDMANPPAGGAGLVGMALEPLASGEGVIKVMINKGLIAGSSSGSNLQVSQNLDGTLVQNGNLNMAGQSILNVASIKGKNDKWEIDEEGKMLAKEMTFSKLKVKKDADAEKSTIGEGKILAGESKIVIENENVNEKGKIFITFRTNPGAFWWISKQEEGKFEVSLNGMASTEVVFDYWLVGVEEEQVELIEPVVPVVPVENPGPANEPAPEPAATITPTAPAGKPAPPAETPAPLVETPAP